MGGGLFGTMGCCVEVWWGGFEGGGAGGGWLLLFFRGWLFLILWIRVRLIGWWVGVLFLVR